MKTSENGAPILTGSGLQSVHERIRQAFQEIHNDTSLNEREIKIVDEIELEVAPAPQTPPRSLEERAGPILRVAGQCFQHAVGRRHHHNAVYRISVPTETAQELFDAALKALGGER